MQLADYESKVYNDIYSSDFLKTALKLEKELIFEIFLTSDFAEQSRGTEPHDVESGDLNGDGIGDLVALVHDKLLIYLGE